MKTRFDCADSWTTATGEEIQIKEMTTIHLMNLFSMFVRRPDRTMAMLVSDIDSGEYAERVWLPRKTEDVKQSIANVTSMSEAELIDYALSSPLGEAVKAELVKRGVQLENSLAIIARRKTHEKDGSRGQPDCGYRTGVTGADRLLRHSYRKRHESGCSGTDGGGKFPDG